MLPFISIYKTITASSLLTLSSTGRGRGSPKLPFMNRKPQQTSYYTIATKEADLHNNSLLPNKRTINKQFMSQYQLSTLECYLPETDWSTILGGIESAFNYLRSVPKGKHYKTSPRQRCRIELLYQNFLEMANSPLLAEMVERREI